jgi:hypothetical protein
MNQTLRNPHGARVRSGALATALLFFVGSCRLLQSAVEAPGKVLQPTKNQGVPPDVVQSDVMRFTDRFDSEIVQATHDFAARVGTTESKVQALGWSIAARTAALSIASAPNPNVNLLDMIVFVTLGRRAHEEHWTPDVWHEGDQPMVDAYRELETDIWEIAAKSLDAKQLEDLRAMIESWREDNPSQAATAFVRLPRFERLLASRRDKEQNVFESLGNLLSLDPLAGLEPAKREIAEARLLGERVLFYAQRAPLIFSTQAELLGLKMTNLPAVQEALEKSGQVSQAAASLVETAAGLPDAIRTEREEAVRQVSDELTRQREGVVQDVESVEAPVGRILGETRTTIEAMKEMSVALQSGIQSLDTFIARVNENPAADDGGTRRPFDVREYGEAAARIDEAAKDLDAFVRNVDRSEARSQGLLDELEMRSDRTLNRMSKELLFAGLVLIGAGATASLAVRRISSRWSKPARTNQGS